MYDYPSFSFPYQLCPHGKNREVFTSYGSVSQLNTDGDRGLFTERVKGDNYVDISAVHPVLPLSKSAEEVSYPWLDRVMGKTLETNKKAEAFAAKLHKLHSQKRRSKKTNEVCEILKCVAGFSQSTDTEDALKMKPWFEELLQEYNNVATFSEIRRNNCTYTGGCLAGIRDGDSSTYVISPVGQDFTTVHLKHVTEQSDGILQADTVSMVTLPYTVSGIKGETVQNEDFIGIKTHTSCYLFRLNPDSAETLINLHQVETPGPQFQSLDISPYIPGECTLATEDGNCYLWSNGSLDKVFGPCQSRFPCSDTWCQAHFGCHPRQVVYSDQTVVQLYDLRSSNPLGLDLFSLPSSFLHPRERIRTCEGHRASPFYHVIATDFSVMLTDERFTKYPVLKWDHMLPSPPQYLSTLDSCVTASQDKVIYVGSQRPADVHGFRFTVSGNQPPQAVSVPWRAANITDIAKWPAFTDECSNPHMVLDRLTTSLAGIHVSQWSSGHVVFQLDSQGEIYHQVFRKNQRSADVTFSAGLGSHNLKPLPSAIQRAKMWIASLVKHVTSYISFTGRVIPKDVSDIFKYIQGFQSAHMSCSLCLPSPAVSHPDSDINDPESTVCLCCRQTLKEGRQLTESIKKGNILSALSPDSHPEFLRNLVDIDKLPSKSALSRLLLKGWKGESDIQEILLDKDKDVLEMRKQRKENAKLADEDMTESSVLNRLMQLSSQQDKTDSDAASCVADIDSELNEHAWKDSETSQKSKTTVSQNTTGEPNMVNINSETSTATISSNKEINTTRDLNGGNAGSSSQKRNSQNHRSAGNQLEKNTDSLINEEIETLRTISLNHASPLKGVCYKDGCYETDGSGSLFTSPEKPGKKQKKTKRRHSSVSRQSETDQSDTSVCLRISPRKIVKARTRNQLQTNLTYTSDAMSTAYLASKSNVRDKGSNSGNVASSASPSSLSDRISNSLCSSPMRRLRSPQKVSSPFSQRLNSPLRQMTSPIPKLNSPLTKASPPVMKTGHSPAKVKRKMFVDGF